MKNDTTDTTEIEYILHTRTDAELITLAGRILGTDLRLTLREAIEIIRGGYHGYQKTLRADPAPAATMHTTITPRVIHPLRIDPRTIDFRRDAIISTGHMSAADQLALHAATSSGHVPEGYYARTADGWIFRTPWHPDDQPDPATWQDLGLSNELAENIRTIAHAGFCRVEFDADAPRVPGLHWFDW